jgi:hypothetical protein
MKPPESFRGPEAHGDLVARALADSWRDSPPPLTLSADELAVAVPLLCRSGAAPLAWRRLRHHPLAHSQAGDTLRGMYLLHTVEAQAASRRLVAVLERLRSARVEPLLVKGWAIARRYPEPGLRPYSDIDLIVRPDERDRARGAVASGTPPGLPIDWHLGTERLDTRSFEDLTARAEAVTLGGTTVRVLGPEDHLRVLSLHALRHDVGRPIWLCDLAVALATRAPAFDWDRCLGTDERVAGWVLSALALAHRLLGAPVGGTPAAARAANLPGWLVSTVLRRWCRSPVEGLAAHVPLGQALPQLARDPARLWEDLLLRWDRPIKYTLDLGRPFTPWPRWPLQVAGVARRLPEVIRALTRSR